MLRSLDQWPFPRLSCGLHLLEYWHSWNPWSLWSLWWWHSSIEGRTRQVWCLLRRASPCSQEEANPLDLVPTTPYADDVCDRVVKMMWESQYFWNRGTTSLFWPHVNYKHASLWSVSDIVHGRLTNWAGYNTFPFHGRPSYCVCSSVEIHIVWPQKADLKDRSGHLKLCP